MPRRPLLLGGGGRSGRATFESEDAMHSGRHLRSQSLLAPTFIAAALAGCRDSRPNDTGRMRVANESSTSSPYFADTGGQPNARPVPGTETGRELQAPQVIPAVVIGLQ